MNDILTIVMPVKGREEYTKRWLQYYDYTGIDFPVIVADGSETSQEALFNKNNISYKYYGVDSSRYEFMSKMSQAMKEVNTPLVVLLDNDDFYSVEGIKRSAAFLCENSDYASARGAINDCAVFAGRKTISYEGLLGNRPHIVGKSPLERVNGLFANYFGGWHDLTYTRYLQIIFDMLTELKIEFFLGDIFDFTISVFGNIHRDQFPYLLHELNSPKIRNSPESAEEQMRRPEWIEEFQLVLTLLSNILATVHDIKVNDAFTLMKNNYRISLKKYLHLIGGKINNAKIIHDDRIDKFCKLFEEPKNINLKQYKVDYKQESLNDITNYIKAFL